MLYHIELRHIDSVRVGDTVECSDGRLRTVCQNNLKVGGFCGTTLFGDSYKLGTVPVRVAVIITPGRRKD